MRASPFLILALAALIGGTVLNAKEKKITAEEVVREHLDSIGSAQARTAIHTRIVEGRARMKLEAGETGPGASGLAAGTLNVVSSGSAYRISLPFKYADYWGEQLAYDGAKTEVGFAYIQKRSPIGDFIYRYDMLLEEGLFGGVLSTAWPLLERDLKQPNLEYAGLKKMGDQQVHVLTYRRKKGQADLRIELFFDAKTFRHVRTAYNLLLEYDTLSPALAESQPTAVRGNGTLVPQGTPSIEHQDAGRQGARYRLEEYFDDFKMVDGVTLPAHWNIIFERAGDNKTVQREWAVIIDKITHNQPLAADAFRVQQPAK